MGFLVELYSIPRIGDKEGWHLYVAQGGWRVRELKEPPPLKKEESVMMQRRCSGDDFRIVRPCYAIVMIVEWYAHGVVMVFVLAAHQQAVAQSLTPQLPGVTAPVAPLPQVDFAELHRSDGS
jgi:hypothetical protein